MLPILISMTLVGLAPAGRVADEAQELLQTIEALQQPVQDCQCEFEGKSWAPGQKMKENFQLGEDELIDSFSGTFIWKAGGDFRSDSLHRGVLRKEGLVRVTLVVRMKENRAERYHRMNDAAVGQSEILQPWKEVFSSWSLDSPRNIRFLEEMEHDVDNEFHVCLVHDDQIDGRPLKVLEIRLKLDDSTQQLARRYWVDLRRSGQVVRVEMYLRGEQRLSRTDVTLAPFKVGDQEVWMPVSAESTGYATGDAKNPVSAKPEVRESLFVVKGTMEFNKHPKPEAFTIKYKPGTPVSDHLQKLTYEFGQQKISERPSKSEMGRMLKEQLAQADEQKSLLAVADLSEDPWWTKPWLVWSFGGLVVLSLALLWTQRRGR